MSKTASKNKRTITTEDLAEYQGAHRAESRVRYNGINARIAAMETNVERWLKNNHEDVVAQIEVNRAKLIAIEGSVNMLGQRIDAMRHEQVALSQESRSAPAEEWVPVIGEYYTATADLGWYKNGCVYRYGHHAGRITEHLAMCDKPHSSITFSPEHHGHILRPATVQEIADHKAKEEQRAKEAEWAKVSEFHRRVKLLVKEMLEAGTHNEDGWLTVRRQEILGVLDRNEIKLP